MYRVVLMKDSIYQNAGSTINTYPRSRSAISSVLQVELFMKKLLFLCVFICTSAIVFAEFRIWEDSSGEIWEAEFVTLKGEMILLEDQSGTVKECKRKELSGVDRDYLDERCPPNLNIDISKTTDGSGSRSTEKVTCNLRIKQIDTQKYDGELTVVLLVLGEDKRTGSISVASRSEEMFMLPENHGQPINLSSRAASFSKNAEKKGRLYGGYLAVVWDRFGNAIAIETNKPALQERAEKMAYVSLRNRKK